ncbi:MAG: Substrate-binding region of ABC-type glycine betaine transport system [Acidobacteria bacterium]|nr:Substrate-binding region of ABC-type glycine betaine transport system [Acidobacteriota bacterium]
MKKLALLLVLFSTSASLLSCEKRAASVPIVVGSKNFTESVILGELVAQKLESAGCTAERKLNMGGTLVCDSAIEGGSLDAYVEYSGTALTAILHKPSSSDRAAVDRAVRAGYAKRHLRWGPNLGFNNTFAMIVRRDDARQSGLAKISDLRKTESRFQPGFGYEFVERPDGWNGLVARYGLRFANAPKTMDLGLTYKALASKQVDMIAGNSTDGLIDSLGLVALQDDLHYFPPYDAAVVTREDLGRKCSGAPRVLESLANTIDDATMRRLNFEVDSKKRDVADVVREFLRARPAA